MSGDFVASFNQHDWSDAERWMFNLKTPVTGYEPFSTDKRRLTKRTVHPNCHCVPRDAARYDSAYFGRHIGDEDFFDELTSDYEVFPVALTMEPRKSSC